MQFRTPVHITRRHNGLVTHDRPVMFLGSCFAANIGSRLADDGFDACVNPTGTLYNPLSIAAMLRRVTGGIPYGMDDLVMRDGLWHSFGHHSSFSSADPGAVIAAANAAAARTRSALAEASAIFITLGTAYVYRLRSTGAVVANCHKFPAADFLRARITVDEAAGALREIVASVRAINPDSPVIFTVSPIRHLADGLHDNQLSKATLLLAVSELCAGSTAGYFPSYEIMMDDLRDYRFYASDMTHPSDVAIDYIYECFADTYLTPDTLTLALTRRKEIKRARHRPIVTS